MVMVTVTLRLSLISNVNVASYSYLLRCDLTF